MKYWTVAVRVPAELSQELKDDLFLTIADAAYEWEPEDRAGWDVEVIGYPESLEDE